MHILDSDYIEVESRRRTQLAALQWQTVTRISIQELRSAHLKFIFKVYFISLLLFLIVATQWWFLTVYKTVQMFFIVYNYVILAVVFVHFLMLTLLQYMLKHNTERPKTFVIIYIILMTQIGSVTIARPTIESNLNTYLYSAILTVVMWSISFILATIRHMELNRSSAYLSLWSQKYYLTTSVSLLMTMEFNFVTVQLSIALVLLFFISIFFIIWGHSIGSIKFCREEANFINYYLVLHFFNMISLMTNAIIFIQRIIDNNTNLGYDN